MKNYKIDTPLFVFSAVLAATGLFVFVSASVGLFARKGFSLGSLFFDQIVLGIILGAIVLFVVTRANSIIGFFRRYALHIFITAIILNILVFVPVIGLEHNGAHRWVDLKFVSFQPSEVLKLATVIYLAALIPLFRERIKDIRYSMGITVGVLVVPAMLLVAQKDTGTFMVIFAAVSAMILAGGAKIRHFFVTVLVGVVVIALLALVRPHVKERILTFVDPSRDPQGASYQIQKSLIAIGSGGVAGRGFGQSIQKFSSLPEPTGDSIFAVAGEEFGFIGGSVIIALFLLFSIRGLGVARSAKDPFSGLLAVGIVILIVAQSFENMAAMLGLIPLTGVPLVFVSKGGTALLFAFFEVGILLNISKK